MVAGWIHRYRLMVKCGHLGNLTAVNNKANVSGHTATVEGVQVPRPGQRMISTQQELLGILQMESKILQVREFAKTNIGL